VLVFTASAYTALNSALETHFEIVPYTAGGRSVCLDGRLMILLSIHGAARQRAIQSGVVYVPGNAFAVEWRRVEYDAPYLSTLPAEKIALAAGAVGRGDC